MPIDLNTMTNREIEDVEEYVGRPIMGFLNRAFDAATKERKVEGTDPRTGQPFEDTEEYLDQDELMDKLPTKIMNALNCVSRRRIDPEFTIDKWADATFGDDGTEPEEQSEEKAEDPTPAESSSATETTLSVVPASSTELNENGKSTAIVVSEPTPPSVTSTPDTP